MKRSELIELLKELAKKDLAEGAKLFDHPCSIASRELAWEEDDFKAWLNSVCFQRPTPEAYDLARDAWKAAIASKEIST